MKTTVALEQKIDFNSWSIQNLLCTKTAVFEDISKLKIKNVWANEFSKYCVKSVQVQVFFWSLFTHIQSICGKIRARKNSVVGEFSRNESLRFLQLYWKSWLHRMLNWNFSKTWPWKAKFTQWSFSIEYFNIITRQKSYFILLRKILLLLW